MTPGERAAHDALVKSGYTVVRRGWPDFLVVGPRGELFAIEWKEISTGDKVRPEQQLAHDVLALAGIPTLVTGSLVDIFTFQPPPRRDIQRSVARALYAIARRLT